MHIAAISGSLRKDSFNTALLRAFGAVAPEGMQIEIVGIGDLPMYSGDIESPYPAAAQAVRDAVERADGLIIATPEYNRSIPGALKNAIDWLTRPYGHNSFALKPLLLAGVSSGKIGTAVAQSHVRQMMVYLEADIIGQPELYIGPAQAVFDTDGNMQDGATREMLAKALGALKERVGRSA